jgi:hypothetical protein
MIVEIPGLFATTGAEVFGMPYLVEEDERPDHLLAQGAPNVKSA